MSRAWLFRLITPLLAVLLVLGVAEGVLRLVGYDPLGKAMGGRQFFLRGSDDPWVGYELVPGAVGSHWGTEVRINSLGFRDREYASARPPGVQRVIVLGDSITFGNHLAVDDTYPELVERRFAAEGQPVEVLNLGVGGYDVLNEVGLLRSRALALQPDVVVLGFCINDLGTHSANLALVRVLERYGPLMRAVRVLQFSSERFQSVQARVEAAAGSLEREEEFAEANAGLIAPVAADPALQALVRRFRRHVSTTGFQPRHPFLYWYGSQARLGRLRFAFEALAALADENGFRALVLLVPYLDEEGHPEAYRLAYEMVRHEAERAGLGFIDATPPMRDAGLAGLMQVRGAARDPLHPNERGHAILAGVLHRELRRALQDGD